jgi:2'-5' RNA ligase
MANSYVMALWPAEAQDALLNLSASIPPGLLRGDGLVERKNLHVTIRYGFADHIVYEDVQEFLDRVPIGPIDVVANPTTSTLPHGPLRATQVVTVESLRLRYLNKCFDNFIGAQRSKYKFCPHVSLGLTTGGYRLEGDVLLPGPIRLTDFFFVTREKVRHRLTVN